MTTIVNTSHNLVQLLGLSGTRRPGHQADVIVSAKLYENALKNQQAQTDPNSGVFADGHAQRVRENTSSFSHTQINKLQAYTDKSSKLKRRAVSVFRDEFGIKSSEDVCEFKIAVHRAKGGSIPKRAVYRSGGEKPLSEMPQDVQEGVHQIEISFKFANGLLADNKIVQDLQAQNPQLNLSHCDDEHMVVLDYDPDPSDDAGKNEGFPNAANTRLNGVNLTFVGKAPSVGSTGAEIFASALNSKDVIPHEYGHGVLAKLSELLGVELLYNWHTGAANESFADKFAVALRYAERRAQNPDYRMTREDFEAWGIGRGFLKEGLLRHVLEPEKARDANHKLGPSTQVSNHRDVDYFSEEGTANLLHDALGVHDLNSIPNVAWSNAMLAMGGDAVEALQIELGALVLAMANQVSEFTFADFAKLQMVSAHVLLGEVRGLAYAQALHRAWKDVGVLDETSDSAELVISKMTRAQSDLEGDESDQHSGADADLEEAAE